MVRGSLKTARSSDVEDGKCREQLNRLLSTISEAAPREKERAELKAAGRPCPKQAPQLNPRRISRQRYYSTTSKIGGGHVLSEDPVPYISLVGNRQFFPEGILFHLYDTS
jgi:hypothetical protein